MLQLKQLIADPQSTIDAKSSDIESTNSNSAISAGGTTVVIGGMSYATSKWMRSQWEKAGLPTANVEFINYTDESKLKQIKETKNVTKIMGFSAGGILVWKEIDSNPKKYNFIGLIDPTSRKVYSSLPNNVYSMSNSGNWGGYPKIKSNLAIMEKNGVLNKTSQPHINIPYEFFLKYKDKLK